jgi:hypothetical protein
MALTFAYDIGKKRILYQNDRGKKLHPNLRVFYTEKILNSLKFRNNSCLYFIQRKYLTL